MLQAHDSSGTNNPSNTLNLHGTINTDSPKGEDAGVTISGVVVTLESGFSATTGNGLLNIYAGVVHHGLTADDLFIDSSRGAYSAIHNGAWGGEATGDILMRINGLPPGEYELKSYHNHWELRTQSTRNCLIGESTMPNMPLVKPLSLPVMGLPEYGGKWNFTPGTGMGATVLLNAYDIDVTRPTSDDWVSTSLIKFHTDGFSAPDGQIDTGDMAKLLSHLIVNGDPDNNYEAAASRCPKSSRLG